MSEVVEVGSFTARPGKEAEAEEAFHALLEPTRREDGCILYALHRGAEEVRARRRGVFPCLVVRYSECEDDVLRVLEPLLVLRGPGARSGWRTRSALKQTRVWWPGNQVG